MTDKTIISMGKVGDDYFGLKYSRKSKYNLEYFLTFDPNLYFIYKSTRHQKEVSYEEFLDFNYCSYTFFKKDLYSNIEINKWIDWFINNTGGIMYLDKPTPPLELLNKIKIKL